MRKLLTAICLAVLLSGCLTVKETNRKPIAIGMTMEQVRERFGPPDEVPQAGEDGQVWEYVVGMCCYDNTNGPHEEVATLHFDKYGTLSQVNDLPGEYIKGSQ